MLESHLNPGNQSSNGKKVSELDYGVSITDGCISWEETHTLIQSMRDKLITVLPLRQQKRSLA
jgi:3-deoxy-7-phosphoheptulonate synthase